MYQQVKLQARLNSLWMQMQNTTGVQRKPTCTMLASVDILGLITKKNYRISVAIQPHTVPSSVQYNMAQKNENSE